MSESQGSHGAQVSSPQGAQPAGAARSVSHLRLFLFAMFVDTIGSGLWMPVGLIFFTQAAGMPAQQVGLALTAGGLLGLLAAPLGGSLVDRWGPGRFVLLSNVIRAAIFCFYPLVSTAWQVALLASLFAAADRLFWVANTPLMRSIATGRALDRLFANQNVIRIVGLGVGAAASGLFAGSVSGLRLLAYINAASYVVAAVIIWFVVDMSAGVVASKADGSTRQQRGWRAVLADRPYLGLVTVQLLFALCAMSFVSILPLVAYDTLGGPAWLPGMSIVVGNVVLALAQNHAVRSSERTSRQRALIFSSVGFAVSFLMLAPGTSLDPGLVVPVVLAASIVGAVAETIFSPLMTAAADEAATDESRGRYSALFQLSWGLATVAAPALFTGLLTLGNSVLWLTCAVLALATIPLLLVVARKLPARCLLV